MAGEIYDDGLRSAIEAMGPVQPEVLAHVVACRREALAYSEKSRAEEALEYWKMRKGGQKPQE